MCVYICTYLGSRHRLKISASANVLSVYVTNERTAPVLDVCVYARERSVSRSTARDILLVIIISSTLALNDSLYYYY